MDHPVFPLIRLFVFSVTKRLPLRTVMNTAQIEFHSLRYGSGAKSKSYEKHYPPIVHFSSKSNEWATPWPLFQLLDDEFHFTLDPCSTHANAKCKRHFTIAEDGLCQNWSNEVVFMNPPYGREIGLWMRKAVVSAREGATVVCLVPARTDTAWWHDFAVNGEIRFLRGRVKFGDSENSAPFPSAVVIFRPPRQARRSRPSKNTQDHEG